MSSLTVMITGKRAFARIAFPLHVALVLLGYRLCPVLCRPCVPGKSPATTLLSLWPSAFWDFGSLYQRRRGVIFFTRCRGSDPGTDQLFLEDPADWHHPENRNSFRYIFVFVAAATLGSCRGTGQQNIAFQMFSQLRR